jgi:hypothetical protein
MGDKREILDPALVGVEASLEEAAELRDLVQTVPNKAW